MDLRQGPAAGTLPSHTLSPPWGVGAGVHSSVDWVKDVWLTLPTSRRMTSTPNGRLLFACFLRVKVRAKHITSKQYLGPCSHL